MRLTTTFKSKIGTKILLALLWLSLFSLVLFGYIAFHSLTGLGQYALKSNISLGNQAVNDSMEALKSQAKSHLLRLAKNQADLSSALLEKVETEIKIVAEFASQLWKSPSRFKDKNSYSQNERPGDIYAVSVYALAPGVHMDAVREEVNFSTKIDEIFIPVLRNDPNINTLALGTKSGVFRSYPWRSGRDPSYDPRRRSWYRKAAEENKIIWTEPYIHAATNELIITCAKAFYGNGKKFVGVVEADVTLKVMIEEILSTQIGTLGYVFLIDSHGKIVARPGLSPGDVRWDETYDTANLLESQNAQLRKTVRDMIAGNSGIKRIEISGGEKYIAYAPVTGTHWSLGIVMPIKEIVAPALTTKQKIVTATENTGYHTNRRIKSVLGTTAGVFLGIIFLVFLTAYRLSKKITQPILALNEGAKIVGSGNLDYQLNVQTGDEIEALAGTFNKMTQDLKTYVKELTETTAAKERIESELKIAHDIQMASLPKVFPPFPDRHEFDIYAILEPAKEVGGDFYDFFFAHKNRLCFVIGDVAGKGVPAALFMAAAKTLIKSAAKAIDRPDVILDVVNKEISDGNDSCTFVTVFFGVLNVETGEVSFINAGHNPPLIIRQGKDTEFLTGERSTAVGIDEDSTFKRAKLILQPGDALCMYTDGVTEAFNRNREQFSEERLKKIVSAHQQASVEEMVRAILQQIKSFSEEMPQSDDITVLALRYFRNT